MPENKHLRFFLTLLYIALGVVVLWGLFKFALPILAPFIIAFIISRIITAPVTFLEKKLRLPRPLVSGVFTVLFYGTVGTALYFLTAKLFRELVIVFDKLRTLDINQLVSSLNDMFLDVIARLPLEVQDFINSNIEGWISEIISALRNLIGPLASFATNFATSLPSVLIFIIVAVVSTHFLCCDYAKLRASLASAMPQVWRERYRQTKKQASKTLVSYLRALLILLAITFVELSIGFAVLGIRYSLLLAAVIALIDALPILGVGGVLIPWAIIALFMSNYKLAIGLTLLYGIIVVVRNTVEPKIVGTQIGLHPLVTLLSMYVGLRLFGVIGMFMPIPVALLRQFHEWGYFDFLKKTNQ